MSDAHPHPDDGAVPGRHAPPPLPRPHVARPRLTRAVAGGGAGGVTLVVAPAGWGKTTLLAEWAGKRTEPTAWLALDPLDRDVARLARGLATALEAAGADVTGPRLYLESRDTDRAGVALAMARAWAACGAALVLDDLQALGSAEDAHALVAALVRWRPDGARLVLGSRTAPAVPTGRLRAAGHLTELGPDALGFRGEEADTLIGAVAEPPTGPARERLYARLEGWPAGLGLLAGLLRTAGSADGVVDAFTGAHRHVVDYLAAEVLDRLRPDDRDLLLRTSILHRLEPELCDAVADTEDSGERLEALERAGAFVTRLDPAGRAYRCHPLFRELLLDRARRAPDTALPTLHLAAGRWLATHGAPDRAIDHLLEAGAAAEAADLLETLWEERTARGGDRWLLERLDRIPDDTLSERPILARLRAWLRAAGSGPELIEAELDALPAAPPDAGPAPARCLEHALRAGAALSRQDAGAARHHALAALGDATRPCLRSIAASLLQGVYRFGGDPEVARLAVRETRALGDRTDRPYEAVRARAMLGILEMMRGRFAASEAALREALRLGEASLGADAPPNAMAHQFLGYLLYEWDRLDEAERRLRRAIALAEPVDRRGVLSGARRLLASTLLRAGDEAGARAALAALEAMGPWPTAWSRDYIAAVRAGFELDAGEIDAAARWLRARPYGANAIADASPGARHSRVLEYTTFARVSLALGEADDALTAARALGGIARAGDRRWFTVKMAALEAAALDALGRGTEADTRLEAAMETAAREGFVRVFADEARWLLPALRRLPHPNGRAAYQRAVVRAAEATHATLAERPALTDRESTVLHLIARGRSNKAIATELGIAVSTVKTHLHNLYRKLGVRSRTQALARAETLTLL